MNGNSSRSRASLESPTAALLPASRRRRNTFYRFHSSPPPPQQRSHAPFADGEGARGCSGRLKPGARGRNSKKGRPSEPSGGPTGASHRSTASCQGTRARALQRFYLRGLGSSVSGMLRMARALFNRYLGEATGAPKAHSVVTVAEPYFGIPVVQPPVAAAL